MSIEREIFELATMTANCAVEGRDWTCRVAGFIGTNLRQDADAGIVAQSEETYVAAILEYANDLDVIGTDDMTDEERTKSERFGLRLKAGYDPKILEEIARADWRELAEENG